MRNESNCVYVFFLSNIKTIVHMQQLEFEWDNKKDTVNIKKHGVSFNEA